MRSSLHSFAAVACSPAPSALERAPAHPGAFAKGMQSQPPHRGSAPILNLGWILCPKCETETNPEPDRPQSPIPKLSINLTLDLNDTTATTSLHLSIDSTARKHLSVRRWTCVQLMHWLMSSLQLHQGNVFILPSFFYLMRELQVRAYWRFKFVAFFSTTRPALTHSLVIGEYGYWRIY